MSSRTGFRGPPPELVHRPKDAATFAREAHQLLALGLSVPDAAQAMGLSPPACAELLKQLPEV